MDLQIGAEVALRAVVAERIHLGGDDNIRLEANGRSFWLTESALAAFVVNAHPVMVGATAPAKGQTDEPPAPKVPPRRTGQR